MNKLLRPCLALLFCMAAISLTAQHKINLPLNSTQRLAEPNSTAAVTDEFHINYEYAEQYCLGRSQFAYIWQLNSRITFSDTMLLKEAGQTFDSIVNQTCIPFNGGFPARLISLEFWIGHSNSSGMTDTIVLYIESIDSITSQPNGTLLWTDTIFTTVGLSPTNSWFDIFSLSRSPGILVPGNFFAGVKYYGAAADTFGIIALGYDQFANIGSAEATYGKAFRKHTSQNYWRPDTLDNDYFYDQNANNVYDVGMNEAFPFQTCMIYPTIAHYNVITGTVFKDINLNGILDSGEPPRTNTLVTAGNFSATTNTNGDFIIFLDSGNYVVQPVIHGYFTVSTPPANIAATSYTQTYNAGNFATNDIPNIHDLRIDATRALPYVPGFIGNMTVAYENSGTLTLSGTIKYVPDSIVNITYTNPIPSSTIADTLLWTFNNLLPGEIRYINLSDSIPFTTLINTLVTNYTEIQPIPGDFVPADNVFATPSIVVASCDPNDKTPFPTGIGALGEIVSTQKLTYVVRFQNTGTYPAYTVVVVDTLDADLDISTFEFNSSSHPCTWAINSDRKVTFTFNNIMLADSFSNELASHGFLKYSILPNANIAPGTSLTNTAHIYFDFNSAVITNTTLNSIFNPNSTQEILLNGNNISAFPNPFTESVSVSWNANNPEQPTRLMLCDISGRIVRDIPVTGQQVLIQREGLQNGLYFFRLETASGKNYAVGKVIAQ